MIQSETTSINKQSAADAAFNTLSQALDGLSDASARLISKISPALLPEMGSVGENSNAPKPIVSPLEEKLEQITRAVNLIASDLNFAAQRCVL